MKQFALDEYMSDRFFLAIAFALLIFQPDIRLLYRKTLRPILPVLICVISDDLDRLTLLSRICILRDGVGWILQSADPRSSSDQSLVHSFRAWDLIAVRTVDIISLLIDRSFRRLMPTSLP